MTDPRQLELWTIYESPRDFPGVFVARKFVCGRYGAVPTDEHYMAETLEAVREKLPATVSACFPREENDSAAIVETWI